MASFSRNPAIESAAVEKLGLSVDQVKRRTIAELTKELKRGGFSTLPVKTVDPAEDKDELRSALKKSSDRKVNVSFGDKHISSNGNSNSNNEESRGGLSEESLAKWIELHKLYKAKVKFRRQLEADPDFTEEDLRDWDASVERTRQRVEHIIGIDIGDEDALALLWEKWERREAKLAEMTAMGIMDSKLTEKWSDKQATLLKILKSVGQ